MAVQPATLRLVGQAIAAWLNGTSQPWHSGYTFTAQLSYWLGYEPADLDTLRVDVLLGLLDSEAESRASQQNLFGYTIVVQKRVDRTSKAAVNALVDLVSAFADSFELGKNFVPAFSTLANAEDLATADGVLYRCTTDSTITGPPGVSWVEMNPLSLQEKPVPIIYSPDQGDTRNLFAAVLQPMFKQI